MMDAAESCEILATTKQTTECHRPEDYSTNHLTALKQNAYYYHHQQQQ